MKRLINEGKLIRKFVHGQPFITHPEIVFGEERAHEKGVQGSRKSKIKAGEWESMTSVLKELDWHFKSDAAVDNDPEKVPDLAYAKLSEAICALERLMKDARAIKADQEAGLLDKGDYPPCCFISGF
jgi:hypothetical protein